MPHPLSKRPTYTDNQLSKYLSLLFHSSHCLHNLATLKERLTIDPLSTLTILQRYHLGTIPWGDVALHYSPMKSISLDAEDVFEKPVVRKLGGCCMEVNSFYANVLRSLGVKLYTTGGRISNAIDDAIDDTKKDPEGFAGWEHIIILAIVNSQTYHIDVGFANFGTLSPVLLQENSTVNCVPGLEARLIRRVIPDSVTDQKLWVLETRDSHSNTWKSGYCFGETEFLPQDFRTLNFRTMRDPTSWFTRTLILTKVLLEEKDTSEDSEAVGTLTMLGDALQRRIGGGEAEILVVCKSEEERIEVLSKWFGVCLNMEEKEGIIGLVSEIVGGGT